MLIYLKNVLYKLRNDIFVSDKDEEVINDKNIIVGGDSEICLRKEN